MKCDLSVRFADEYLPYLIENMCRLQRNYSKLTNQSVVKSEGSVKIMKEQSNVLIVASRTDLWCSMRDIVTNKKYRVAIAGDGTKAIDLMQKIHFDIVYLVGNTHANNKDAYNEIKQYAPGITVKQINQPHSN